MAMVGVDTMSLQLRLWPELVGLIWGQQRLGSVLHSSDVPRELSRWFCYNDSTINNVVIIITSLLSE